MSLLYMHETKILLLSLSLIHAQSNRDRLFHGLTLGHNLPDLVRNVLFLVYFHDIANLYLTFIMLIRVYTP